MQDKLAEAGEVLVAPEAWGYVMQGGSAHGLMVDMVKSGCALLLGFQSPTKATGSGAGGSSTGLILGTTQLGGETSSWADDSSLSHGLSRRSGSLGESEMELGTNRCCLLCMYMPAIDRPLSDCRWWRAGEASTGSA